MGTGLDIQCLGVLGMLGMLGGWGLGLMSGAWECRVDGDWA